MSLFVNASDIQSQGLKKKNRHFFLSLSGNLGHIIWVRLQQPQKQRYRTVHAGSFRVSIIHPTMTFTTRSLMYIHMRAYTHWLQGLGTPTTSQCIIFDSDFFLQMAASIQKQIKTHKRLKYEHVLFGQEKTVCKNVFVLSK